MNDYHRAALAFLLLADRAAELSHTRLSRRAEEILRELQGGDLDRRFGDLLAGI